MKRWLSLILAAALAVCVFAACSKDDNTSGSAGKHHVEIEVQDYGTIAVELDGWDWYWHLALPIILTGGAIVMALGLVLCTGRSILTSVTLIIGAIGLFVMSKELYVDRWLRQDYLPGWSLVVAAVCRAAQRFFSRG